MSTKFVSKNANYMIVLKPGVSGNRSLGTQTVPGLYVRFQEGIVIVKDEDIAQQLRELPSFGVAFLEVEDNAKDPYVGVRKDIEPAHVTTEMKHGHAGKREGNPIKVELTPQMKKVIEAEALKMIPGLLKSNPDVLKKTLMDLVKEMKESEKIVEPDNTTNEESVSTASDEGVFNPVSSTLNNDMGSEEPNVTATTPIAKGSGKIKVKNKKK